MHGLRRLELFVCAVSMLLASVAKGQSTNASLSGQVTDIPGLLSVGADVGNINRATNVTDPAKTSGDGLYWIPDLPPGIYEVRISRSGLRTVLRSDILLLQVQNALPLNATLQVGYSAEIVRVEGGIPLVNTESAAVSTVIDRQFVETIPLNGRSLEAVVILTSPVVTARELHSVYSRRTNSNRLGTTAAAGGMNWLVIVRTDAPAATRETEIVFYVVMFFFLQDSLFIAIYKLQRFLADMKRGKPAQRDDVSCSHSVMG